jgi:hypothetical protein
VLEFCHLGLQPGVRLLRQQVFRHSVKAIGGS